ncbi:MAG: rhomboid family intramembrane serine protease [Candidatus Nealsonbacteria bacterium]|nr:rhomboid family intramembrane serine protease [Candidatus Nealsonbacteria bacterium]
MGIYDRDYYREEPRGFQVRAPRTIIGILIVINVAVFLANGFANVAFGERLGSNPLMHILSTHGDTLTKPQLWWQFLTYGFVHDPNDLRHIIFNMLGLFFLGRSVERHYGRKEFLWLYLLMLIFGSVVWSVCNLDSGPNTLLMGASGAVVGVVILFVLNFPKQTLLLFFVLPVPAWLVGVFVVGMDLLGATGRVGAGNVAYSGHLAGAAFAFLYFRSGWNFTRLTQGRFSWLKLKRRPRLRVHDPSRDENKLHNEVDRILAKIHREGENSLTRKERRTLENASQEYKRRQQE